MEPFSEQKLAFVQPEWLWASTPFFIILLFGVAKIFLAPSKKFLSEKNSSVLMRKFPLHWRINLASILTIIALARPHFGETTITIKTGTSSRQVLIALDVSRSMLVDDVRPTRLERAKMLIRSLLDPLAGEQIGLLLFAGSAFLQCPMSTDHDVLREILPTIGPDFIPRGGTNYDIMLQTALASFTDDPNASPLLIVMSDGEALDQSWRRHLRAIVEKGISVITLGIGTQSGGLVPSQGGGFEKHPDRRPVLSRLEPRTLQELASATGGIYLDASQWVDLAPVIKQVESRRASFNTRDKNISQKNEIFHWLLNASVFLIMWSLLTEVAVHPPRRKLRSLPPLARSTSNLNLKPQSMATKTANILLTLIVSASLCSPCNNFAQTTNNTQPKLPAHPDNQTQTNQNPTSEQARLTLLETVKNLSQTGPATPAKEYARFAKETLAYLESAATEIPNSTIRSLALDGLDAVRRGSIRAPAAADWDDLRKKLQRWLEENPPQHQEGQQNQKQQDQNKNSQRNNQQQNNPDSQQQTQDENCNNTQNNNSQSQNSESLNNNHNSRQPDQNQGQNRSPSSNSSNKNNPDLDQQKKQQPQKQNNNNQMTTGPLGDRPLKDHKDDDQQKKQPDNLSQTQNTAQSPPLNQRPATQRIGGQNIKKTDQNFEALPQELRDALILLEQARQNDRPAVLFERMMDKQKIPPDEGKNW